MPSRVVVPLVIAASMQAGTAPQRGAPGAGVLACVWYRGTPAGRSVLDELALVRALGFKAVLWPGQDAGGRADLDRMAGIVGLTVLTPADLERETVRWHDEKVGAATAASIPARVWSAVAEGARVISFDSGSPTGAGLTDPAGVPAPWVAAARAFGRQLEANAELIGRLEPGPAIPVEPPDTAARVVLLDGGRAWVLVAANPSASARSLVARFPKQVPYGPWVSLIDGTDMAMVDRPSDHEYRVSLSPGDARVYVIDKQQKDVRPPT